MKNHWYLEKRRSKYSSKIEEERRNFFFLKDGTMVVPPYPSFNSYWEAMADAIMNYGEDIDDIVSLVFREAIDQLIVKKKLLKLIDELKS